MGPPPFFFFFTALLFLCFEWEWRLASITRNYAHVLSSCTLYLQEQFSDWKWSLNSNSTQGLFQSPYFHVKEREDFFFSFFRTYLNDVREFDQEHVFFGTYLNKRIWPKTYRNRETKFMHLTPIQLENTLII